jgi:hypothetical protein
MSVPRKRLKIIREMAVPAKPRSEEQGAVVEGEETEGKSAKPKFDPRKNTFGRGQPRMNPAHSKVTNGREILPGVDGRSGVARRYRDVMDAICQDQGGKDRLAEARIQLIRRFSAAAVMAEEIEANLALGKPVNIAEHVQLTSAMVRVASRIGINRRAREIMPTLNEYLTTQIGVDEQVEPDRVDIDHDDDHQSDD